MSCRFPNCRPGRSSAGPSAFLPSEFESPCVNLHFNWSAYKSRIDGGFLQSEMLIFRMKMPCSVGHTENGQRPMEDIIAGRKGTHNGDVFSGLKKKSPGANRRLLRNTFPRARRHFMGARELRSRAYEVVQTALHRSSMLGCMYSLVICTLVCPPMSRASAEPPFWSTAVSSVWRKI